MMSSILQLSLAGESSSLICEEILNFFCSSVVLLLLTRKTSDCIVYMIILL